jgi:hypothetical protein
MVEITKQEAMYIRKHYQEINIAQTVKSKRHRGKYFLEETAESMDILNKIERNGFDGKEKFSSENR